MSRDTITVIDTFSGRKNPFWKVEKNSIVTLLYFETYPRLNAPNKFRIILTDVDSNSVIEVDPNLDIGNHAYGLHHMGYAFDTSKVKIEIVPVAEGNFAKDRLSYRLHYSTKDNGDNEEDQNDNIPFRAIDLRLGQYINLRK